MPSSPLSRQVAIIGGGPAGLMAAEILAKAGTSVTVYDQMPSVGRKLLMAGRGGLNLTHSEDFSRFVSRYREATPSLLPFLQAFGPEDLRAWCEDLGQDTFVGSSGRVFPKAFKASPLLRAWLARLDTLGVRFALRHRWQGWDQEDHLLFATGAGGQTAIRPNATILALGGASWRRLGSDGAWVDQLAQRGIDIAPLRPANMGFTAAWSDILRNRFEGAPLKRVALTFAGRTVRGEVLLTSGGLEGGAIYAISADLREAIVRDGRALVHLDLRPDLTVESLGRRLGAARKGQSLSTVLRKAAGLAPVGVAILREANPALPADPAALARLVKSVPLNLTGFGSLERAISTAGGIPFAALDEHLMFRDLPGTFAAGEMLDWEAPTGGYLLQAAFATGIAAAKGVLAYVKIPNAALTKSGLSATPRP